MLWFDHEINIFFINEGAGYRNQLGVTAEGATQLNTIAFDDITCLQDCSYTGYRSPTNVFGNGGNPLNIGDYYSLGTVKAGTKLDFFLRRDGFQRSNTDVWYTEQAMNTDGLQHVMAYDFQNYLVLAWEDLKGGGDYDYNDVVIAVDFGEANVAALESAKSIPEPDVNAGLLLLLGVGIVFKLHRDRRHSAS